MGVYVPFAGHDDLRGLAHENPIQINAPLTAFIAVGLYNSIELLVLIYMTFTHYNSLYFWSMLCTTFFGIFCSALAYIFYYFEIITSSTFPAVVFPITWMFLVTGHSLVLYSRLHFVCYDRRILRIILVLIVIDAILIHTSTTVVSIVTYTRHGHDKEYVHAYSILERIEIAWFTVQETIVSAVYIYYTFRLLSETQTSRRRAVFYQLIIINIIEILMNIALIILQYMDIYLIQTILKVTVYSIKLKLEFAVLRQIVKISHVTTIASQVPDFVEVGQPSQGPACSEASSPSSERARKGSWFSEHFSHRPVYLKR